MQLLERKSPHSIGLIGHAIIHYPDPKESKKIIELLVQNHADLIELQIPFSEPIADGPIFAGANHAVLSEGITVTACFEFMHEMTSKYAIPFIFMTYANILIKRGIEKFVKEAVQAGAKGAIIPDLPLDVASEYLKVCHENNFAAIPVLSPNISIPRLQKLQPYFDGFIYAVARAGVTGSKTQLDQSIVNYLTLLRQYSDLPLALGFGISQAEDIEFLRPYADYAVIGTQTIRSYRDNGLQGVAELWKQLSKARNDHDHDQKRM